MIPQVAHVIAEFATDFPVEYKEWHQNNNYIIVVSCKTEQELLDFSKSLKDKGVQFSEFYEPDIGNKLTAIALVPSKQSKKLCSRLPLAGKNTQQQC